MIRSIILLLFIGIVSGAADACELNNSTAINPQSGKVELIWRTDYPSQEPSDARPWLSTDFHTDWQGYMAAVLGSIKNSGLKISDDHISMDAGQRWWIVPWMDIGSFGREYKLGLTKERSPRSGDLAPNSPASYQLWAVGFYNADGAYTLGEIFQNRCNPNLEKARNFREGTASFKLLFTDAEPTVVKYLDGAPTVTAAIDASGGSASADMKQRQLRTLRLLQVDIAVKDSRSRETGWVFGTFAWVGPPRGDGFFDNLRPVGLQWGNDPDKFGSTYSEVVSLLEGKVDQSLRDVGLFGWEQRPFLGFQGRVNGPADNQLSSCLSCHGASQRPRSRLSIVGALPRNASAQAIEQYVANYFRNISAGELFDKAPLGAAPLDYSLQVESALFRLCEAYSDGDLISPKPDICPGPGPASLGADLAQDRALRELGGIEVPPRQ